jgi:hypothetical protein
LEGKEFVLIEMHGKTSIKIGKFGSETLQLLRTAYGEAVLSSVQVLSWHKAFKDGRKSVEEE